MKSITLISLASLPVTQAQLEYIAVYTAVSDIKAKNNDAEYDCTIINLWTEGRHPADFPNNPHWSPPVAVSHGKDYSMFDEGVDHTLGLEELAESGGTSEIISEINDEIDKGNAKYTGTGGGFDGGSLKHKTRIRGIKMDNKHRRLSLATMIAPSPDWFSGFNNFDMRDVGSKKWYQEVILDCFPWDAGSDDGVTYGSNDSNSNDPVFQLTTDTIPSNLVFQSPEGTTVLPVLRVQCLLNGKQSTSCKKNIFGNCKKNSQCCEGLSCQDVGRKKNKCYPLLYETQSCKKSRDCFGDLECVGDMCTAV